jgi:hypothetical protein
MFRLLGILRVTRPVSALATQQVIYAGVMHKLFHLINCTINNETLFIMKMKISYSQKAISRIIAFVFLCLFFYSTNSSGQENSQKPNFESEWWFPQIQKRKIDLNKFTAINNFQTLLHDSTKYSAVEFGNDGAINGRVMTIKEVTCIYRENENEYIYITAESATHDVNMAQVKYVNGRIETFNLNSEVITAIKGYSFEELQIDFRTNKATVKKISETTNK